MVVHVRKFLYYDDSLPDDSLPPVPLLTPTPPSLIYEGPKQYHDLSLFLIPMFFALGVGFLIVAYFTIIKKYYLSTNNRTRTTPQNLDDDGFVDGNHRPVIDHPIWFINTIGLKQSVIDSISVLKYKKNEGLIEGAVCSICLSEFEEDETLRLLPKCSHAFHVPCIDIWLSSHKNCPTCRAPIVSELVINTQTSELESNLNNLTPIEETSNEDLRNFGDEEGHHECSEMEASENFGELPKEKEESEEIVTKKSQCLGAKGCDFRVFSDLGVYRDKVEAELEPVRRSISMDPSSPLRLYQAMANIDEMEVEGSTSTQLVQAKDLKSEKSDQGVNVNWRISKVMKSPSVMFSFRKGSVSMKRSFSSSGS